MKPMLMAALGFGLAILTAAPAWAASGAEGGDDAFARAIAAYDAGRYGAAVSIWTRLAENGDVDATAALAGLYRQGLGVPRDGARAAALYRRAGLGGHVIAQANLGEMLAQGVGVARDPGRAWAWLRRAADGGNAWAEGRAKGIWDGLTTAARDRARALLAAIRKQRAAPP